MSGASMYGAQSVYIDSHHFCHPESGHDFTELWTPDLDKGSVSVDGNEGCPSTEDETDVVPVEDNGNASSSKLPDQTQGESVSDRLEEDHPIPEDVIFRPRSNPSAGQIKFFHEPSSNANSAIPGIEWTDGWETSFDSPSNGRVAISRHVISDPALAENDGTEEQLSKSTPSAAAMDSPISSRSSGTISSCSISPMSVPVGLVQSYSEAQREVFPEDGRRDGHQFRQQIQCQYSEKPPRHPARHHWQDDVQQQQQQLQAADVEPELWLVQALYLCAECIRNFDLERASACVRTINQCLGSNKSLRGPMVRVAGYFTEALTERLFGADSVRQEDLLNAAGYATETVAELLHKTFYETSPFLKFVHFTANHAILDAFKGAKLVHIIDFNLNYGLQWPVVIQALSRRPGGPPALRLTGLGPRTGTGGVDVLNTIGTELHELAKKCNLKFEFEAIVFDKLSDIKPWTFNLRPGEVTCVNSMLQLHKLLQSESPSDACIDYVLRLIRSLNPKLMTISEQDANHNVLNFRQRFADALHYYAAVFDSIEALKLPPDTPDQGLTEMYFGREIRNIVACEGPDRVERHEYFTRWRTRLHNAGFRQVPLSEGALSQARLILNMHPCHGGEGYRIQPIQDALILCWGSRPMIATSVWECAPA